MGKLLKHYLKDGESRAQRWFRYSAMLRFSNRDDPSEKCRLRNLTLYKLSLIYESGDMSPGEDNKNRQYHETAIRNLNEFIEDASNGFKQRVEPNLEFGR